VGTGELGDLAGRTADTAADIEDLHSLLDANAVGKIVLVTGDGLMERLAMGKAAEMERLSPSVLVQISGEIVVASQERSETSSADNETQSRVHATYCLVKVAYPAVRVCKPEVSDGRSQHMPHSQVSQVLSSCTYRTLLSSLILGRLVVPVLEVLVDGSLLRIVALGEHGGNATTSLGGLAMQGLVEGGVASFVLALESRTGGDHVEILGSFRTDQGRKKYKERALKS
jgi:hypothetical protein